MATCETSVNIFFDILAALISISDVATDVIVTYNFYQKDQMIFFGLSVTFIILAQLSYVFAFLIVIASEDQPLKTFLMFLCLLPISPILSFIFYLTEDPNSKFSHLLESYYCFDVSLSNTYVNSSHSKLKQWMKKKLRKHLGFIMESCIEAFPQSIIQISAIVVYNKADLISIISILISMLSVSSKAFIFSIQFSINIKSLLFIWMSAVTDFIGIFFAISWILYNTEHEAVSTLTFIWQIKVLVCVVPLVFCFSIFAYANGLDELLYAMDANSKIGKIFGAFCVWLMVQILWCFGMVLGTLGLELITFIAWTPPIMLGCDRIPGNATGNKMFLDTLCWILHGGSHNDKIIRTCCANKVMIEKWPSYGWDETFTAFIKENEKNCFMDVKSFTALRTACKKHEFYEEDWSKFWQVFIALLFVPQIIAHNEAKYIRNETKRKIVEYGVAFANFCIAPFYYLSRIFNMLFPFMILTNLYVNGYDIFDRNDVDLFQCIMLLLYISFIFILIILASIVYVEHFYLWHLMPGTNVSSGSSLYLSGLMETSEKKYNKLVAIPIRNALLNAKYGSDIATIIIYYCNAIQVDNNYDDAQITDRLLER